MGRGSGGQPGKTRLGWLAEAFGRTRLAGWLGITVVPAIDRRLIPLTGGRLMVAIGQPVLLLHTRGARSGQPRTTPLLYALHGGGYVIVASKAGSRQHPAWYHNLRARRSYRASSEPGISHCNGRAPGQTGDSTGRVRESRAGNRRASHLCSRCE